MNWTGFAVHGLDEDTNLEIKTLSPAKEVRFLHTEKSTPPSFSSLNL